MLQATKKTAASLVLWLLLTLATLPGAVSLYEDQVGQVDWKSALVGPVDIAITSVNSLQEIPKRHERKPPPVIYVFSSLSTTIAAIDAAEDGVIWRRTLQKENMEQKRGRTAHGSFAAKSLIEIPKETPIELAPYMAKDNVVLHLKVTLISVHVTTGMGQAKVLVTGWDGSDGSIIWQQSLEAGSKGLQARDDEKKQRKEGKGEGAGDVYVNTMLLPGGKLILQLSEAIYLLKVRTGDVVTSVSTEQIFGAVSTFTDLIAQEDERQIAVLAKTDQVEPSHVFKLGFLSVEDLSLISVKQISHNAAEVVAEPRFVLPKEGKEKLGVGFVVKTGTNDYSLQLFDAQSQTLVAELGLQKGVIAATDERATLDVTSSWVTVNKRATFDVSFSKISQLKSSLSKVGSLSTGVDSTNTKFLLDSSEIITALADDKTQRFDMPENLRNRGQPRLIDVSSLPPGDRNKKMKHLVLSFEDGSFAKLRLLLKETEASKSALHVVLIREESLFDIASAPVAVELPRSLEGVSSPGTPSSLNETSGTSDSDARLVKRFSEFMEQQRRSSSFLPFQLNFSLDLFFMRLKSQYLSFFQMFSGVLQQAKANVDEIFESPIQYGLDIYNGEVKAKHYSLHDKHNFGFVNIFIVISAHGKLVGINSENGDILFSVYNEALNQYRVDARLSKDSGSAAEFLDLLVVRAKQVADQEPCIAVASKAGVSFYNGVTGALMKEFKAKKGLHVKALLKIEDHSELLAVLYDDLKTISVISDKSGAEKSDGLFKDPIFLQKLRKLSYISVSEDLSEIKGYRVIPMPEGGVQLLETFRLVTPGTEKVVSVGFHTRDQHNTVGRHIGGGSVMIKHINHDIFAVFTSLTSTENPVLGVSVLLVDANTGSVLAKYLEPNCLPSTLRHVIFENNVIYSCYTVTNHRPRTEINSLSVFWDVVLDKYDLNPFKIPSKLLSMKRSKSETGSVIIEQRGFYIDKLIQSIGVTTTLHGISEKSVLFGVGNGYGQILMIDRRLLDPRRPIGEKLTKEEKEERVIPYSPMVPLVSESIVTYHQRLDQFQYITTFPTKLESTCLLFATGLDLFSSRIQPSAGFDLLPEEFNYPLLICMVIGLLTAVTLLNRSLKNKKLRQQWK